MQMQRERDKCLFIYEDSGKGIKSVESLSQSNTLGVKLINLTARQLGGSVVMKSEGGLRYEVRFDCDE